MCIRDRDDEDIDVDTVKEYLDIFERLFLTDNQPPFSTGVRSSVRVKQAVKRHFSDPSLACSLLKATPARLMGDLETLGFLFEALCERDLKIYADSFGGTLYHYQDYQNREIDAVIELADGQWCAFEIKLGANQIDAAAKNLLMIKKQFESDPKGKPPAVLCVLCGMANAAYRRPDGVFVAVSYTHLDVYKRQVFHMAILLKLGFKQFHLKKVFRFLQAGRQRNTFDMAHHRFANLRRGLYKLHTEIYGFQQVGFTIVIDSQQGDNATEFNLGFLQIFIAANGYAFYSHFHQLLWL